LNEHKNPLYDASAVEGARVLSDYQVELTLVEPMATFVSEVLLNIPIMPKHIWEKVDDPLKFHTQDWEASLIGTGPYILKEYKTEHGSYLWVANPDYWWGQPAVDEIRMVKVEHSEVALLTGDIDCTQVGPKEIDMFKGKSEFTIVESIPYKFHWVTFDLNRDSAVANKDFRKAVAHAIDKQEFLDRFGHGFGNTCQQGGIAKTHPYFNGNVIEYEYDQAKAKAILDNLGYEDIDGDGFRENPDGTPMVLSMLVGSARQAELVAFKMEEIGVRVDIETVDSMALMKHFRQGAKGYDTYYNGGGHLWLARDPDFLRHNSTSIPKHTLECSHFMPWASIMRSSMNWQRSS
jgi:peptide/nickel transport system substrate-binding protein